MTDNIIRTTIRRILYSLLCLGIVSCNNQEDKDQRLFYKFTQILSQSAIQTAENTSNYQNLKVNESLVNSLQDQYLNLTVQRLNGSGIENSFVPHGLWLNLIDSTGRVTFKNFCSNEPVDVNTFPIDLYQKVRKYYTDVTYHLYQHEWIKHGTCLEGYSPQKYFTKIFDLYRKYSIDTTFLADNASKTVPYEKVYRSLVGDSESKELICYKDKLSKKQILQQLWLTLDYNFEPLKLSDNMRAGRPPLCDRKQGIFIPSVPVYENVSQLEQELVGKGPISVGFDIDDTVLDSNILFEKAREKFSGVLNKEFWTFVNQSDSMYSVLKKTAKLVLDFHKSRKDKIYFITLRTKTQDEKLSQYLSKLLDIKQDEVNLVFTSGEDKSKWIKKYKNQIYYGDSDTDIISAMQAGSQPIRFLRATFYYGNRSSYRPGFYGENIIINSNL